MSTNELLSPEITTVVHEALDETKDYPDWSYEDRLLHAHSAVLRWIMLNTHTPPTKQFAVCKEQVAIVLQKLDGRK